MNLDLPVKPLTEPFCAFFSKPGQLNRNFVPNKRFSSPFFGP